MRLLHNEVEQTFERIVLYGDELSKYSFIYLKLQAYPHCPWYTGIVLEISSYFLSEQNKNFGYFLHRLDFLLYQTFHECEFSIAISISDT